MEVCDLGPFYGCHTFGFGAAGAGSVTEICGLNASGKSFLFGALSWVLGAQDTRSSLAFERRGLNFEAKSQGRDSFFVTVDLEVDNEQIRLTRKSGDPRGASFRQEAFAFFDERSTRDFEGLFAASGGHGSGDLLLMALSQVVEVRTSAPHPGPLIIDDVLGRLDLDKFDTAIRLLGDYQGQVIVFTRNYGEGSKIAHLLTPGRVNVVRLPISC